MTKVTQVRVKTKFEALHRYPMAPDSVSDLRNYHRHNFVVRVAIEVFHADREVEFFLLRHDIDKVIDKAYPLAAGYPGARLLGECSCEMIADKIYEGLKDKYKLQTRNVQIIVGEEDDTNEAIVTWEKQLRNSNLQELL